MAEDREPVIIRYAHVVAYVYKQGIEFNGKGYQTVSAFKEAVADQHTYAKLNLFYGDVNVCTLVESQVSIFSINHNDDPAKLLDYVWTKYMVQPYSGKELPDTIIIERFFELLGRVDHDTKMRLVMSMITDH